MLQWLISVWHLYVVTPHPTRPFHRTSTMLTCTRTNPSFTVEVLKPSLSRGNSGAEWLLAGM